MMNVETLRELLSYNPETGDLFWNIRMSDKVRSGDKAGSKRKDGYIAINVRGFRLTAHRVAWAIHTGEWPKRNIDHINGNPGDNRIANLRDVSQRENIQNLYKAKSHNKVGFLGVSRDKNKFSARIVVDGKQIRLGRFKTPEEAHATYIAAKLEHHVPQAAILAGHPVSGARIVRRDRLAIK